MFRFEKSWNVKRTFTAALWQAPYLNDHFISWNESFDVLQKFYSKNDEQLKLK